MIKNILRHLKNKYYKKQIENKVLVPINDPADFNNGKQIIEFLGSSGIGKSFHFNCIKKFNVEKQWMNIIEHSLFIKNNYKINYQMNPEYNLLLQNAFERIQQSEIKIYEKYKMLSHYINIIEYDYQMKVNNVGRKKVITDEGIFLNFSLELLEFERSNRDVFEKFLMNRAFVFLEGSMEYILKNLKKRADNELVMGFHRGLDEQGIIDYTLFYEEKFKRIQDLFDNYKIPYLKINVEEDLNSNLTLIAGFINSLKA